MARAELIPPSPIDVAVIEDDADQRRLIAFILERAGFSVVTIPDIQRTLEAVAHERMKVILCDYDLPDGNGVELCGALRQNPEMAACYFILMSASSACELPAAVLDAGADDYLTKPVDHQELIARVRVGSRMWALHNELRRAAITDGLTRLYNHDHFNRVLEAEVGRSHRYGHPLALIMMDMDYFKAVNDTFGHLAGNATLEAVARVLRDSIRDIDSAARFGGEEFTVILPEARAVDAIQVAERIRGALAGSLHVDAIHGHSITASFGIADSDDPRVKSSADLVDLADRALFVAKNRGRDQVACSYDLDDGIDYTANIQTDEIEMLRRRLTALTVRAKDVYMQSVRSLLQALDEKDPYTARHSVNVAFFARQVAEQMGCSQASVKSVYNAALLHDIGKVGVPDRILMKRTSLAAIERMVLDQVPLISTRIIEHLRILESEIQIIRHQREYFDGSGLPAGLRANQIPIGSRILLVADAFDAMATDRVYRRRRPIDEVLEEMHRLAGSQFDPRAVTALRQILDTDREAWQRHIDETIQTMRAPAGARPVVVSDASLSESAR